MNKFKIWFRNWLYDDHSDEAEKIIKAGADQTYLTMSEAGVGLAEHVFQADFGRDRRNPEPDMEKQR